MYKASILVVHLVFLAGVLANHVFGQPPTTPTYGFIDCKNQFGSYAHNSSYESNIKAVLSTLKLQSSTFKFYSTSAGNGNETVYGQYYCRGDVNQQLCSDCIKAAAEKVIKYCSLLGDSPAKAAVIWYEECTLRYENQSMNGIESEDGATYSTWKGTNSEDPVKFSAVLNGTMSGLVKEATAGNNPAGLFATGNATVSGDVMVYCLVQCSPDLNGTQCSKCLWAAYGEIEGCCGSWPATVYAFLNSCQMMYSRDGVFYYDPIQPPAPPSSDSQPPPPSPSTQPPRSPPVFQPPPPAPTSGGSAIGSMKLCLATAAVLGLMLC